MFESILVTAVIGIVAGFLAGKIMKGGGFGLLGDLVVGILGAVLGGFLAGLVGLGGYGILGSIVLAVIGACILLWLLRLIKK